MVIAPGKSLFTGQPDVAPVKQTINATTRSSLFIVMAALIAVIVLSTAIGSYLVYKNKTLSIDSVLHSLSGEPAVQKEPVVQPQQAPPSSQTPQPVESSSLPHAASAEPSIITPPSDSKNMPETTNSSADTAKPKDKAHAVSGNK